MEVKKHIVFGCKECPELLRFLKKNEIPYEDGSPIVLDISDQSPFWPAIQAYVNKYEKTIICLSETCFTKSELKAAQWLRVRCKWRNGYPQPEDGFGYEKITYTDECHCKECGSGLAQIDSFRMKKEPKWGKRHFMALNWVEDELFANETAKALLQDARFSGIEFREVRNKNGSQVLPDVYQLVIPNLLDAGLEPDRPSVDEIHICPYCGVAKYHPTGIGMLAFKGDIFHNAPDIVKTTEVFGWGHSASREILIRQNVYQFLTANHLDRGLVFEPVEIIY